MIDLATMSQIHSDIGKDIGKMGAAASPAIVVSASEAAVQTQGLTLQDWVFVVTIIYLLAQLGYLLWKWLGEYIRTRRAEERRRRHPEDE